MFDIDIFRTVQFLLAILVALTVHEASHAGMAFYLGDPTPKNQGRVTLNPIAHLDPMGTVMMVLSSIAGFGFGWGKPVMFNPFNLRKARSYGMALVSIAGPLSNLILAGLLAIPLRFGLITDINLAMFIIVVIFVNIFLALFNLIPVPPLDGFHAIQGVVSYRHKVALAQIEQYGPILLLVLVFFGMRWIGPLIGNGAQSILQFYLTIGL